ncbi:MAG: PD-(D/E)XK nuclease family protein [Gammaproteobacteria bacterium]|nr:PD-(D/E)XK nuclease family protein [Gammaproteobacteria bacterium]
MGVDGETKDFWPWDLDPDYRPHQRASGLSAAKTCPGYMFLGQAERLRKASHQTVYTGLGTIGHRWIELMLQAGRQAAMGYLERQSECIPEDFPLDLAAFWRWLKADSGLLLPGAERLTEEEIELEIGPCRVTGHVDLIQVKGGQGSVIDWKWYRNKAMLPTMVLDLQMYTYGLGAFALFPELETVDVHRVSCFDLEYDSLQLHRESLEVTETALREVVQEIWDNRTTFRPGAQCTLCLLRRSCPAYRVFESTVDTSEIAPYRSGEITSAKDAVAFLLAAKQVEERLEQGRQACKLWVGKHGRLDDATSGKAWGPWASSRDVITDAAAAIGQLGKRVDSVEDALKAASTTKAAMERVLKGHEMKPKERRAFFAELRDLGVIEKKEGEPRWEWRSVPQSETETSHGR